MLLRSIAICAVLAAALFASPGPAPADILPSCIAKNGRLYHARKECRSGDKPIKIERPMGGSADVAATATIGRQGECSVLAEFLRGDVALCVGHDVHDPYEGDGYGPHCFLWLETEIPLRRTGAYGGNGMPVRLGDDEVTGRHTDGTYARARIPFVDGGEGATGEAAQMGFYTEEGYLIKIEDVFLFNPSRGDCRASARVSARQR